MIVQVARLANETKPVPGAKGVLDSRPAMKAETGDECLEESDPAHGRGWPDVREQRKGGDELPPSDHGEEHTGDRCQIPSPTV